jgi:DNA repair photolyase
MTLIRPFDPWGSPLCTCPPKYSLSAYTGCAHGCIYCYASSYIPKFYQPRVKKDFIKKIEKELPKLPAKSIIAISNSSDPYQPLEKKFRLTRKALEIFQNYNLKINLVTKSDLILEDLSLLKKIRKILVTISLTTLDENLSKKLEPNCPKPSKRLKTIKKLTKFIPVVVRFDPLIYPINTKNIKEIVKQIKESGARQIISSTYKAKPDNFKRINQTFPKFNKFWEKVYKREGQKIGSYLYLEEEKRKILIKKVRNEALKVGLEFSTCRERLGHLNISSCDGSSLF